MSQLMPVQQKAASVRSLLERSKPQIAQALPRGYLTVDRLTRIAMTSVQRTPKLLDCDPISLVGAVIQSAQLGLEPDGVLGQAYLIPYGNKVQFQPGYKGLLALARRSGDISGVEARVVHEKDIFRYAFGLAPSLEHVPSPEEDRGAITAVYAIVRMKDGSSQWDVMSRGEIEAHRKRYSQASKDGPWVTAWEEMAKKTVLKRVLKLAPASVELQTAIALDEHAEAGLSQGLDAVAVAAEVAEKKTATALDALTESLQTPSAEAQEPGPATQALLDDDASDPMKLDEARATAWTLLQDAAGDRALELLALVTRDWGTERTGLDACTPEEYAKIAQLGAQALTLLAAQLPARKGKRTA